MPRTCLLLSSDTLTRGWCPVTWCPHLGASSLAPLQPAPTTTGSGPSSARPPAPASLLCHSGLSEVLLTAEGPPAPGFHLTSVPGHQSHCVQRANHSQDFFCYLSLVLFFLWYLLPPKMLYILLIFVYLPSSFTDRFSSVLSILGQCLAPVATP